MSRPVSTTRLLVLIAALTNPFCWLPLMTATNSVFADVKTGDLRGTVFVPDADGQSSVVTGATVTLNGPSLFKHTVTDERGDYSFGALAPGSYRIEVTAP